MSFIALALTLCVSVGTGDDEQCNTYFIDSFAGNYVEGQPVPEAKAMGEQWGDCMNSLDTETMLARIAARSDHATKPTAKDGQSTSYRAAYLKRFNIVEDVKSIDRWEYGCARINDKDMP